MGEHRLLTSLMRPFYRKGRSAVFSLPLGLRPGARMLCIDPGDLSELVFHAPLLNALHRSRPDLQMDFLIPEGHAPLVVPSGLVRQCTLYKKSQLSPWRPAFASLLKKVGAGAYDMTVVTSFVPRPRLELAALASGAPLRLGPSHSESYPAVNCELRSGSGDETYLGDRIMRLAPFLCLEPHTRDMRWPLPVDKMRHIAQQIHFHKPNPDQMLIGIDPGLGKSGFAFALDNLEFLVKQLSSQLFCRFLPVGMPDGNQRLKDLTARLGQTPVGLPRENLLDMVLLLSQCDLFLAGNTDFFHMAVALGIPSVGLFSPKDTPRWHPTARPHAAVLTLVKGEKVDIATLMEAVEKVTGGRSASPAKPLDTAAVSTGVHGDADGPVPGDS